MRPSFAPRKIANSKTVDLIRQQTVDLRSRSDGYLADVFDELRVEAPAASVRDPALVVPTFALTVESIRRNLGMTLYDVQLLAGLALVDGAVAEMQTGEGKTLSLAAPAVLFSLAGRGVHVMTANDYLARRDHHLLEPCFRLLGVSAGLLSADDTPEARGAAYQCDVTYGSGNDFGFDYLKDQVTLLRGESRRLGVRYRRLLRGDGGESDNHGLQREQAFAIVDEIDSVLIDEANTPLILSAPAEADVHSAEGYAFAWRTAQTLRADEDFLLDEQDGGLRLTDLGLHRIRAERRRAGKIGLNRSWQHCVEQALRARNLLKRDVNYAVVDGQIRMVDATTGRLCADRSLRDGLHQLLEIKEGLEVSPEKVSLARITRQRFFRCYDHLCGLTGTATPSSREFQRIYSLKTVVIPTHRPSRRTLLPTRFFAAGKSKWEAIAEHIQQVHATGRPILAGTTNIENSLLLAEILHRRGVGFQILNGVQDADEAAVVAAAGQLGAVTIATNMAGRGTDIRLGVGVAELGGLHVVGTEHQPSVRLDAQLAGRAGRQGDPGSAQFFLSGEDPLIQNHAPLLAARMERLGRQDGEILADLSAEVAKTQRKVECWMFQQRRRLAMSLLWQEEIVVQLTAED
ncbi:MAG: preprotein translocase subunit SecA [Pirellulaceae bacterium]